MHVYEHGHEPTFERGRVGGFACRQLVVAAIRSGGLIGLNDRTKLRPMVAARERDMLFLASEEAAIREVCASPGEVWHAEGGVPIVGAVKEKTVA